MNSTDVSRAEFEFAYLSYAGGNIKLTYLVVVPRPRPGQKPFDSLSLNCYVLSKDQIRDRVYVDIVQDCRLPNIDSPYYSLPLHFRTVQGTFCLVVKS